MSVDLAWSASSLQRPVQAHLNRVYQHINSLTGGNMTQRVLGGTPRPLPNRGPQAIQARSPIEQRVMGTGVFASATPAPKLPGLERAVQQPGTNVVQPSPMTTPPGVDTALATAVPKVPTPTDGIPAMQSISGWSSPGARFPY